MQTLQSRLHPFRLVRSYTDPQQMYALRKCRRVSHRAVEGRLRIELVISHQENIGRTTETANVREHVEMVEGHLERLHATHRESGHCSVIAIGERAKRLINKRNQH